MIGEIGCSTLLYWLLALVIVFPPQEAISSGLTIENFLKKWLGSESLAFIHYHIKRSSATIIIHCLLLPGYVLTLLSFHPWLFEMLAYSYHPWIFGILFGLSLVPLIVASFIVLQWSKNNWRNHPLAKTLSLYTSPEKSLNALSSEINNEFVRIDKVSTEVNSVCRIVATDNWLIKVTSYKVYLTSLRDAILCLESSVDAPFMQNSTSPAQFLTVRVASLKNGIKPFTFRINSSLWTDLERKLVNPVVNTRQIVVHQTLADRFAIAFEETVRNNPTVSMESETDLCIGCMSIRSNIKLDRRCRTMDASSDCTPCSCKPMWCLSCLSKWFAARQDQTRTDTWLSSKAPCPTCRSKFCLLDVSVIQS